MKPHSRTTGFTLVEVLVVLVVVGLLAALLFAVFGRARENGRAAVCQNNEKQIFLAFQSYLQDHDSRFPDYKDWSDSIASYVKDSKIFICPTVAQHNVYHPDLDYGVYPDRINDFEVSLQGKRVYKGVLESAIPNAANWILLNDIGSGEEPDMRPMFYPSACSLKLVGTTTGGRDFPTVHNNGGNYLFADGHVKWMSPQTGMDIDCSEPHI